MENKTFIIKYEIILVNSVIKNKEIKVYHCFNSVGAQCKLEKYLQKNHEDFKQLIVHSCKEDIMGIFDDMFNNLFDGNDFFTACGSTWRPK
jgi:hypothetical protein